jgi:hypothetical protein
MNNPFARIRAWINQPVLDKLDTTMSTIADFAAKVTAHNDKIDAAIAGLSTDLKDLAEQIARLQTTNGEITPEDQSILDGIEARSSTLADKLAALDSITPPATPRAA